MNGGWPNVNPPSIKVEAQLINFKWKERSLVDRAKKKRGQIDLVKEKFQDK